MFKMQPPTADLLCAEMNSNECKTELSAKVILSSYIRNVRKSEACKEFMNMVLPDGLAPRVIMFHANMA